MSIDPQAAATKMFEEADRLDRDGLEASREAAKRLRRGAELLAARGEPVDEVDIVQAIFTHLPSVSERTTAPDPEMPGHVRIARTLIGFSNGWRSRDHPNEDAAEGLMAFAGWVLSNPENDAVATVARNLEKTDRDWHPCPDALLEVVSVDWSADDFPERMARIAAAETAGAAQRGEIGPGQ